MALSPQFSFALNPRQWDALDLVLTGNPGPATALLLETWPLPVGPLAQETRFRVKTGSRVRTEAPHPRRAEGGGGD